MYHNLYRWCKILLINFNYDTWTPGHSSRCPSSLPVGLNTNISVCATERLNRKRRYFWMRSRYFWSIVPVLWKKYQRFSEERRGLSEELVLVLPRKWTTYSSARWSLSNVLLPLGSSFFYKLYITFCISFHPEIYYWKT